jgi:hypothetical protein
MALQKRISDEISRYETVKKCLDAFSNNNTDPLKVVINPDGSYGFYITVGDKDLIFRKTFKDFYQRCMHCELTSVPTEVEKFIISSMQDEILKQA